MYREQEKSYFSGRKWANLCELHKFLFVLCLENIYHCTLHHIFYCASLSCHIYVVGLMCCCIYYKAALKKSHFAQPIEQLISGSVILFNQVRII